MSAPVESRRGALRAVAVAALAVAIPTTVNIGAANGASGGTDPIVPLIHGWLRDVRLMYDMTVSGEDIDAACDRYEAAEDALMALTPCSREGALAVLEMILENNRRIEAGVMGVDPDLLTHLIGGVAAVLRAPHIPELRT
ncbi:hypothetical protein [Ancylobacter radicis]|uniref:Tat pathway signal protein n=1 Tax=Ancylobacter radicis TaxID=2836179 RepID=A0ABS5R340_9HYPH|nr:hypothetical protein [Ancylobacter radicis]MBS9476078.1 hypothetical protein [Ancylobacter radicis]